MAHPYRIGASLISGILFGFGLALSGMLDPARVRGFLDVAGRWDPSLAFVLGGALLVSVIGFRIARHQGRPAFDDDFHLPPTYPVDARLVIGAALFGIGWGLTGLCPGPAVVALSLAFTPVFLFVLAMIGGMIIYDRILRVVA